MARAATKTTPKDLEKQLETLRADMAQLTEALGDMTRIEADEVADTARSVVDKARAGVAEEYDKVRATVAREYDRACAQGRDVVDHADAMIREKPAVAMGVAAGAGLLIGLMMSRKS